MRGVDGPALEGEIIPCTAELKNIGGLPLRALRLLIKEDDLLCCSSDARLGRKVNCLEGELLQ